jgi:seryl-tRNA synthetase
VLDLKELRRDPEAARAALERRRAADRLDEVLQLDARRRELLPAEEALRAEQNQASKAIGQAKQGGGDASEAIAAMKDVAARAKALQAERAEVDEQLDRLLAGLPNLPLDSSPIEEEVVREWGAAGRTGRDHLELLGGLVDMESGAKLSGSRFAYLRGPLVMLEFALVRWAMELLSGHGFEPIIPPVLVREEALYGTGFLPDTEQQIYRVADDDLYLVGTSEVALASIHRDEILEGPDALPRRYAGFSSCFRREAGAAGKDTRGLFRVHQFDKLEMFSFVAPESSEAEHERILGIEEEIMQALEIPYRVVNIAAWDLGASAAKKYDVEAWLPGQGRYRELTSCSNTTDYQARRLGARYRPEGDGGGGPRFVHTLNGTAVAVGRTIIAVVENGQRDDGTIAIPEVLHGFGAPASIPAAAAS